VPFYPVVPALGIVSCFALIFTVETRVLVFFAWYTGAMIILYFVYGMHNSELAKGVHVPADGEPALFPEDEPRDASGKPVIRP
jgi:APA family basic amino acid/polyamine antiporter